MLDTEVCRDLAARCGGAAAIGICGENTDGILSRLNAEGADGVTFIQGADGCAACIFVWDGPRDFAAEAAGRPYIIVAGGGMAEIEKTYGCACVWLAEDADGTAISAALRALVAEFPVRSVGVRIPGWMQVMPQESSAIAELSERVRLCCGNIKKMSDLSALDGMTEGAKYWAEEISVSANFADGTATVTAQARDGVFFELLSEIAGDGIDDEYSLMRYVRSAAEAKRGYEKVRDALDCARVNGYGVVRPAEEDMAYEQPQMVRQGSNVGIKLRATAPSYHIIRVDVTGEVSPIMGDAAQSEGIVKSVMSGFERDPEETWNTDVFGKSLRSMVQDGLAAKVGAIQDETRGKLRKAITRMVNEGKGGVICIIL